MTIKEFYEELHKYLEGKNIKQVAFETDISYANLYKFAKRRQKEMRFSAVVKLLKHMYGKNWWKKLKNLEV